MINYDGSEIHHSNNRRSSKWWYLLRALKNAWKRGETTMMMCSGYELFKKEPPMTVEELKIYDEVLT